MHRHAILRPPLNAHHHANEPHGILFIRIWVLIQSMNISVNSTSFINNVDVFL